MAPVPAKSALPKDNSRNPGRILAFVRRNRVSREQLAAIDEITAAQRLGTEPIAEISLRQQVRVSGVLQALTYLPSNQSPALIGALYDGTGTLDIVWMGMREVPGIEAGIHLLASGVVAVNDGRLRIFNPEYEILSPGAHS